MRHSVQLFLLTLVVTVAASFGQQSRDDYLSLGYERSTKNDYEGAIASFTEAIRLDPNSFAAYTLRGTTKLKKSDFEGSISDLTKAIELNPQLIEAYLNRGLARDKKGDLDGAFSDFSK